MGEHTNITPATRLRVIYNDMRVAALNRAPFACPCCGRVFVGPSDAAIEVDHVIAVAEGGTDEPSNLRVLCVSCNRSKGKGAHPKCVQLTLELEVKSG